MVTEYDRLGKGPGRARITCARQLHLQSVCCTRTDFGVMPDMLLGDKYEILFFTKTAKHVIIITAAQ